MITGGVPLKGTTCASIPALLLNSSVRNRQDGLRILLDDDVVMTKPTASEGKLKRRIAESAKYAQLDQLALSPQCGCSSAVHGNNIAVAAQRSKLRLVIETAQEVWE